MNTLSNKQEEQTDMAEINLKLAYEQCAKCEMWVSKDLYDKSMKEYKMPLCWEHMPDNKLKDQDVDRGDENG